MVEEIFVKAFITKIANSLFDMLLGKKDPKENKNNIERDDDKIKFMIEQKLSEEMKNLSHSNDEIKFLDAIRGSFIQRIHNIFNVFDIKIEEIPIFLKQFNITHKDVLYEENILEKFDNKIIDYISETLEINKDWIYGREKQMIAFMSNGYYKNSTHFCKKILETYPSNIYILTERVPNKEIDEKNNDNRIYMIIEYNKIQINNNSIKTYKIFDDSCRYGYWRCRYELKRFVLGLKQACNLNIVNGRAMSNLNEKVYKFSEGKTTFENMLRGAVLWYPDDYIELPEQSSCSIVSELEELKQIIAEYDTIKNY